MQRCDVEVMKSAHGVTSDSELASLLVAFARSTLGRLADMADTCGRVLGGGVAARFRQRLEPVLDVLAALPRHLAAPPRHLPRHLGVEAEQRSERRAEQHARSGPPRGAGVAALVLKQAGTTVGEVMAEVAALVAESKRLVHGRSAPLGPRFLSRNPSFEN
jgi:hypothetical protein